MDVKCPHCGTEYEVERQDMYRYTKCEVCGKGFVIGAASSQLSSDKPCEPMPRRGRSPSSDGARAAIPNRLAHPLGRTSQSAMQRPKRSKSQKILMGLYVALGFLLVVGIASYGCYLYFGDAPRLARGIAHYERGAYPKAMNLLLPLAKKGFAKAQLLVGDCYANGQGIFMDTEEAVKWYRLAADQEMPEALHRMFECCRSGSGIDRNIANAAKYCRKAAEAGQVDAMFDMGMLYVIGDGVEGNAKSAFKWFRKGAERGHPMSLYKLGYCYKYGFGVEKDDDEASKWQNKAVATWRENANAGDVKSMINIAEMYMEGDAVELDKEEGAKWYRKAAELGDAYGQQCLALCFLNGEGVEKDAEKAAEWMLKSAEQGTDRDSQRAIGLYYLNGTGVEKNPTEAVKWFERAMKKGDAQAKYWLAMCHLNGVGINKDAASAEKMLVEAADDGCKDAKEELERIKRERAEEALRLVKENAEKKEELEGLALIEGIVEERVERVNDILSGKLKDEWAGFGAAQIAATDSSVSTKMEPEPKALSKKLSIADSLDAIGNAAEDAANEAKRLHARLDEIIRVKKIWDEKELESRKEPCTPCNGTGTVGCARCNGKGELFVKENEPCPICSDDNYDGFTSTHRRGVVSVEVDCSNCRGRGEIWRRPRCQLCGGNGYTIIRETGRFDRKQRCDSCGGSGKSEGYSQSCPKCHGSGKIESQRSCSRCGGKGTVATGSKVTCQVCDGKCNLTCESCGGKGFTYRPKADATK